MQDSGLYSRHAGVQITDLSQGIIKLNGRACGMY